VLADSVGVVKFIDCGPKPITGAEPHHGEVDSLAVRPLSTARSYGLVIKLRSETDQ
jgi:hypothetical protein